MDILSLIGAIQEALKMNEDFLDLEFSNYAPIVNSKRMLKDIQENLDKDKIKYLREGKNKLAKLNVGLLAAKALDFDNSFIEYGKRLHYIWANLLELIGAPHPNPRSFSLTSKQQRAYEFYTLKHNYSQNKALDHMSGIDFTKDVDANFIIKPNTDVYQWIVHTIPQGDYYAKYSNSNPDCLGINDKQEDINGVEQDRIKNTYEVKAEVTVLRSTAAAVLDTWSVKGKSIQTNGGCTQYFYPVKSSFERK